MLRRIRNYLVNEGAKLVLLALWIGVNASLFYFTFAHYYYGREFYYLHEMLGYGLCISRATAACINLNACLILLPMCRGILRILRAFPKACRQCRRLMDKSKSFHIACGYTLCLMSAVHCGAHAVNAINFCEHFNPRYLGINVAAFAHQNPLILLVKSIPGITGLLMVALLTIIAVTASSPLRRANYRRFWKMHHLFIAFYILLLLHASSGILKYQSNTKNHIPGCFVKVGRKGMNITVIMPEPEPEAEPHRKEMMVFSEPKLVVPELFPVPEGGHHHPMPEAEPGSEFEPCQQPEPQFKSCPTEAWMWMSVPLFLYIIERISRCVGSSSVPLQIKRVVQHPDGVIELEFYQKDFQAQPGQSIWLRCPQISFIESHPFTLTSLPSKMNHHFTIHMLVLGEWTEKARRLLMATLASEASESAANQVTLPTDQDCSIEMSSQVSSYRDSLISKRASEQHLTIEIPQSRTRGRNCLAPNREEPQFYAHGPYGSAMMDVFRYEVSLCVAGGIGITPFAAILNMILQDTDRVEKAKLDRLYLVWICKTIRSFQWFVHLINSVQNHLWNANKPDFLNVYLHVTSSEVAENVQGRQQLPGLERCRLQNGRPNLKEIFGDLSNRHQSASIGVFCCGPRSLNDSVRNHCLRDKSGNRVKFVFNKESF